MARYVRTAEVTFEQSGDRMIVLDAAGETMTTLNPVGALVWEWLAEPADVVALTDRLDVVFPDVGRATLHGDVQRFLDELYDEGLVVRIDSVS